MNFEKIKQVIKGIKEASNLGEYPEMEYQEIYDFQWELVQKYKLLALDGDDKKSSPRDFLESPFLTLGEYAASVVDTLVVENYELRGVWDVFQTLEERFLSVSTPQEIKGNFALWAAAFIEPKPEIFILPPEVMRAIVASVIYSLRIYSASKSAEIAKDLVDYWGLNIFADGDVYRSKRYCNPKKLREKLFFLHEDFLLKRVEF